MEETGSALPDNVPDNVVKGSFIGPEDDEKNEAGRVSAGNKKLVEQVAIINKKAEDMGRERVQLDPLSMIQTRLNLLTDFLFPPEPDEHDNFGNPERIDLEIQWNELMLANMDNALSMITRQKLLQGTPAAANPVNQVQSEPLPPNLIDIARRMAAKRNGATVEDVSAEADENDPEVNP
jgi:hypothetical protein